MEINDKKIEKILKEQRKEYQHYLGACIEDFDSKVGVIAEQFLDIKKILNSHTKTIGSINVDIEIIKTNIEFIKNGFKKKVNLEEFEFLEKRVIRLEKLLQFQKII
ncbi:hypothetical protein CVV26_03160 [Candidatus Kuenenbacteria bacterium HGW-Kuenenbacteria-1]|uniref:Uncharacterized protein n=1 Tax=Candidatus Kuenenbacteria bacterium HGW-Kuenenbacteria-1 TaxID=2013812 RepID=A0A2N1UMW8_9BACT|nr:MAG: hypothetical protein CVV26_03160 [Candidatus Kuenenbacteria bacterium HGW-Kuenenbacteria-1]